MVPSLGRLRREVRRRADPARAAILQRFFKTGPGEYAEGDRFAGLTVPEVRALVRTHAALPLGDARRLVKSPIHEERLLGLLLLVRRYQRGTPAEQKAVYRAYVASFPTINNWDLVDVTAEHVPGAHLLKRSKKPLYAWARSKNLWIRRIAMLSTFHYIRRNRFAEAFAVARLLLRDPEDLIHKAVGWMLREIGKRNLSAEERFLRRHYRHLPRTLLRYAIERFPDRRRLAWLRGEIS